MPWWTLGGVVVFMVVVAVVAPHYVKTHEEGTKKADDAVKTGKEHNRLTKISIDGDEPIDAPSPEPKESTLDGWGRDLLTKYRRHDRNVQQSQKLADAKLKEIADLTKEIGDLPKGDKKREAKQNELNRKNGELKRIISDLKESQDGRKNVHAAILAHEKKTGTPLPVPRACPALAGWYFTKGAECGLSTDGGSTVSHETAPTPHRGGGEIPVQN